MNTNLKSGNALVRFLLSHGEKIGMLGILVCSGMIIWSALGVDRLSDQQTPKDLTQKLQAADQKVKASTYQNYPDEEKIISIPLGQGEAVIKPIVASNFPRTKHAYNRPVLDPVSLRTDPLLYPPEDLEVSGDYGLWASADPQTINRKLLDAIKEKERLMLEQENDSERGEREVAERGGFGAGYAVGRDQRKPGENRRIQKGPKVVSPGKGARLQGYEEIQARSWVTVLARIPIEQQYTQYDDALQMARGYNPANDIPIYGGYIVERAEITSRGQSEWKSLPMVIAKTITEEIAHYPVNVPDVIDPRVNHPILTHPLPPLILREWDERVSHSSMPLASEIDPNEGLYDGMDPDDGSDEESAELDIFGQPINGGINRRSGAPQIPGRNNLRPRGAGMVPPRAGGFGGEFGGGYGGGYGGGFGGEFGGGGRMGAGSGTTLNTAYNWDQETSHVLLRFFDHSVKPGHRYRYRVRLILKDVNKSVSEKHLDKTVTERLGRDGKPYRLTDWSKPSGIASVPLPAQVYLMGAKPAKESDFTDEAELELLVNALNSEFAAEIAVDHEFVRGSVINLNEKVKVIWSSDYDPEENSDEFTMRTGITVLDFSGGGKLHSKNKDLLTPTRALLMDPGGKLFVQSEIDDEEGILKYNTALEQDTRNGRGGAFDVPGGFGGEGFGGIGEDF